MMVSLRSSNGMLDLRLHVSLASALWREAGIPDETRLLTAVEALMLDVWANEVCDNPSGQRADLARGLACLIRTAGSLRLLTTVPPEQRGFWDLIQS